MRRVVHQKENKTAGFQDSEYPVFWVEVWNKYTRQWVSIDPIVMKLIEVCPKRKSRHSSHLLLMSETS